MFHLASVGGSDVKTCVKAIMAKVVKRELLAAYSLHGRQGKQPFKGMRLCSAVFGEIKAFSLL